MQGVHRFVETVQRMSVIERWNNKPNLLPESVAAHSFLVAAVAWGLAALRAGGDVDPTDVLCRAIAHDMHEALTGDILAPTKGMRQLAHAVRDLERQAGQVLLRMLPEPLAQGFEVPLCAAIDETPAGRLVRAADLFAAWLKAHTEVRLGNTFYLPEQRRLQERLASLHVEGLRELTPFARHLLALYTVRRWNNLPALAPKPVAAHAHLVATLAWLLACWEGWTGAALGHVVARALLLEAPKAITGDILYHARTASPEIARGVEEVRARAARRLVRSLPRALRPAYERCFLPLPEPWERLVAEASLVAAYLEALIEVRLGNGYFVPVLDALLQRARRPLRATAALLEAFEEERRRGIAPPVEAGAVFLEVAPPAIAPQASPSSHREQDA